MTKIETIKKSDAADRNVGLLRDDELDAVSGGKGGGKAKGDQQAYMIITLSDCVITS